MNTNRYIYFMARLEIYDSFEDKKSGGEPLPPKQALLETLKLMEFYSKLTPRPKVRTDSPMPNYEEIEWIELYLK
ncbi:MAG: hypothetical protein AAGA85_25805 [Bacteroidota bacterium]